MKRILFIALLSCSNILSTAQTVLTKPSTRNSQYGYFNEFEIRKNNAAAQIAWQTVREENNRGFEIQRRIGNEPWTIIAYVASMAPDGNSSKTLNYLYGDNSLLKEDAQYRIRQIDINGHSSYSSIQTLNGLNVINKILVYPNPSPDGIVNVALGNANSFKDVQVMDINGQLIQQWLSVNSANQQINNLRKGNYIIRIIDRQTGGVSSEKIIVQ